MQRHDRRRTGSDLPGLDLAERQAWQHYLDAVLRFDAALNRALNADHQLSVIDLRVLDILAKSSDGSARMGDLAELLGATRRQMTKRIDRLGERGLVRREPDPKDKRGVVALLNDAGRTIIAPAIISYAEAVSTYLLGSLSTRQISTVAENCWRIGEGLRLDELRRTLVGAGPTVPVHIGAQAFPEAPTCYLPGVDDAGKRCWHQFMSSSATLFPVLNARLVEAIQLALIDILLLDLIAKSPGGTAPMSLLGKACALQPSRLTQQISRLESEGLVRRGPGQGDRRRVVVAITLHGRVRLGPALAFYAREIRRHYLNPMSRQQAIALGDACRRISVPLKAGAERSVRADRRSSARVTAVEGDIGHR
ncbi:MarR family transcriptional regulator [Mycolicibacter heraklionensis]|uniref:MarR family transcriptional regulator n=1 Tax=Mycolicibacter heraklionensis TaxID=512402 RepID=A0A9X7WG28_9MYCO|nr:MarR family transcriptional regulator [Mycolicibacter heraklionensis]QZA07603.1 MarR family transcriptional regulator [Mycolicibacter heraklionensis]